MSEETLENLRPDESPSGMTKLIPVAEAIKYRRRAQQAESQLQDIEQQLEELQSLSQRNNDELAKAEAQRDEAKTQLTIAENRHATDRLLIEAGVIDPETALTLISKRVDFSEELDRESLEGSVEQLLLDKPFLRPSTESGLPPKTASARPPRVTTTSQLAQAAQRAAQSGNRKDVAEYLRLRRQAATAAQG
jgi:TolA-binding protein